MCSAGDGDGCALLGAFIELGIRGGNQFGKAADYLERGCRLGSGEACEGLARLLMRGEGRPKDEKAAVDLQERMCEAGRKAACTAAGVAYVAGRGRPRDITRGMRLIEEGCKRGSVEGCMLAKDPQTSLDVDAAVTAARKKSTACALGDVNSCEYGDKPLRDRRAAGADASTPP
jgi:hypothetical protein